MKRTFFRFFGGTGEFQMKIIIGSDHAGYELERLLWLTSPKQALNLSKQAV